jgi:hypothetical protein
MEPRRIAGRVRAEFDKRTGAIGGVSGEYPIRPQDGANSVTIDLAARGYWKPRQSGRVSWPTGLISAGIGDVARLIISLLVGSGVRAWISKAR